ncbi:DUF2231 domain-containing protein [Sphingomicrobium arenosum]|uniref:DUF2231 domain-containing protein n=1 Tax=Sphingomicrobium arenosum TaxID=2233861 RepID=UPI002240EB78|nr:DUF2231 domain-containing protein [Sphingomicrobium arenosum]
MRLLLLFLCGLFMAAAPPAHAHKGEKHGGVAPLDAPMEQASSPDARATHATDSAPAPTFTPASPGAAERTLDWLGRLHPALVHFPLALFPMALLAALLSRRRMALRETARFLLVAGAISAPVAALVGWLGAVPTWWDLDPVVAWHRWLGTAIALIALPLGWLAWRRPDRIAATPMLCFLAAFCVLLLVQGWLGGSMIHGLDHLAW